MDIHMQWWKLVWANSGVVISVFKGKPPDYCNNVAFKLIPIRLVDEEAEPCEWELTQNDVGVYEFSYFKFCPMCGRIINKD